MEIYNWYYHKFTSVDPRCFSWENKKLFKPVGEELMVENTDEMTKNLWVLITTISNYIVSPFFVKEGVKFIHKWIIEFIERKTYN